MTLQTSVSGENDKFNDVSPKVDAPVQAPAKPPEPGTPEATIINGTMSKALPPSALLPMPLQERAISLLRNPPPEISEADKQALSSPIDPYKRWGFIHDPDPSDHASMLSYWRNQMRDGTVYWTVAGERQFASEVTAARKQASTYERVLPTDATALYSHHINGVPEGGQLSPSSWRILKQVEWRRTEAMNLRQAAGYDPGEVLNLMKNGEADAWKTKPIFTDLRDFDPSNAGGTRKIMDTLTQLGMLKPGERVNPEKQQLINEFVQRQQDLAIRLRTQQ